MTPDPDQLDHAIGRRPLLGAGFAVAATAVVGSCGSSDTSTSPAGSGQTTSGGAAGADGVIVQLADVPVGGAVAAKAGDGAPIIVTQPTAGQAVAFSAKCTHKGCSVAPAGAELNCPCHGSKFDLSGKNIAGPAPSPLAPFAVTVKDGAVVAT